MGWNDHIDDPPYRHPKGHCECCGGPSPILFGLTLDVLYCDRCRPFYAIESQDCDCSWPCKCVTNGVTPKQSGKCGCGRTLKRAWWAR